MRWIDCSTFAVLLAATATGQPTLVVDRAGTGHFTDIPAAIAAAAPGDRVLVLGGRYSSFTVDKPIVVTTNAAAEVSQITVRGVPAGSTCVVAGFVALGLPSAVYVLDCPGRVHLQSLGVVTWFGVVATLEVRNCAAVSLSEVSCHGESRIFDSVVSLERCRLTGPAFESYTMSGLSVWRSHVLITGGLFAGSGGSYSYQWGTPSPRSGIMLYERSEIRLAGTALVSGGESFPYSGPPYRAASISVGDGRVEYDPRVVLQPNPSVGVVVRTTIPSVSLDSRSAGTTLTPEILAPAGALVGLLGSYPAAPLPCAVGDIWLDLPTTFPLFSGTVPASGSLQVSIPIHGPSNPQGSTFTLQAAVIEVGSLLVSTPATSSVR
ncbi:MAG: hypothetical protein IPM29_23205 [Planctomycetes bacterium]|nr:hypothetical protein [Planctomycetota bacterium]